MENQTKDYVINLRVSRQTYDKIKGKAKKNGQTISHLLRDIISDSGEIISDLSSELMGGKRPNKFEDIVSYHNASLAQDRACDNCGQKLKAQEPVTVGETASHWRYYFCSNCRQA